MSLIRDIGTDWSDPVTLTKEEIWQARCGSVFLTTTDSPEDDDGLAMVLRNGVQLRSGVTVRYRKHGDNEALIVREVME